MRKTLKKKKIADFYESDGVYIANLLLVFFSRRFRIGRAPLCERLVLDIAPLPKLDIGGDTQRNAHLQFGTGEFASDSDYISRDYGVAKQPDTPLMI